jgi:hypothetical protein
MSTALIKSSPKTKAQPKRKRTSFRLEEVDMKCLVVAEFFGPEGLEVVALLPTPALARAFVQGFNVARKFCDPGNAYTADRIKVRTADVVTAECDALPKR